MRGNRFRGIYFPAMPLAVIDGECADAISSLASKTSDDHRVQPSGQQYNGLTARTFGDWTHIYQFSLPLDG